MFAYQLAVVVDDAAMGVTEVVRGADLLDSTPRQLYLYHLLGLTPPRFFHFPLLLAPDGRRLSKRDADAGLDSLRDRATAAEVLGKLAYLAGFNPSAEPKTAEELLTDFSWEKVPQADIRIPEHLF
jgi:glutamyl-tRNA synthetase